MFSGTFESSKQQRRPPDLDPPDPRVQHAGRRLDRDQERLAVRPDHTLDRQQVGVGVQVKFLLPAVGVERLAEVALVVQSPTPIRGMPRSLALLRWSPASTPRPPE